MKLSLPVLVLVAAMPGCPAPVIHPTPVQPTDTASCAAACKRLEEMKCEEGKPLEDGTTCTRFCEDTQHSGHALRPSCILEKVTRCQDIDKLCFEK